MLNGAEHSDGDSAKSVTAEMSKTCHLLNFKPVLYHFVTSGTEC